MVNMPGIKATVRPAALRMDRVLGSGGFGEVAQVREEASNTVLAVKRLCKFGQRQEDGNNTALPVKSKSKSKPKPKSGDAKLRPVHVWRSLCSEVDTHLLMADHPGFPSIYAIFHGPAAFFIVMECGTRNFFSVIHLLSRRSALFYAGQLLLGLQALHKRGVVHLDIKDENLLLGPDGNLLIIDFGLAERLDRRRVKQARFPEWCALRQAGTDSFPMLWPTWENPHQSRWRCGAGTPGFQCPQVVFKQSYSYGADLWALGVVIHEWVTGEDPDIRQPPDSKRLVWRPSPGLPYLPEDLDFFRRIFSVDPASRFPSYAQIKAHPIWE
ncbi:kinase-like domain-containing protein, partial [Mycena galericulata]